MTTHWALPELRAALRLHSPRTPTGGAIAVAIFNLEALTQLPRAAESANIAPDTLPRQATSAPVATDALPRPAEQRDASSDGVPGT